MKTLIVGMGVVGTVHGWALSQAGFEVVHKVRMGRAAQYGQGVPLDLLDLRPGWPEHHQELYRPNLAEQLSPSDGFELAMVPTKQYQAAASIKEIKDQLPGADFLLFTANWLGPAEIDAVLPRERYFWGYSVASGGSLDGRIVATIKPLVRLGELDGSRSPRLQAAAKMFSAAGIEPSLEPDIIKWLWAHQAINSGMIGTGLMAGGLDRMVADPKLMEFMVHAVREGLAILAARGVDPKEFGDARPFLEESVQDTASNWKGWLSTEHGRRTIQSGHFKTNPEEMKHFFVEVYRTAKELGLDTPYLDRISQALG